MLPDIEKLLLQKFTIFLGGLVVVVYYPRWATKTAYLDLVTEGLSTASSFHATVGDRILSML